MYLAVLRIIGQPTMNEKSSELAHYGMLLEVSVPPNNRTTKYNKHQILLSLREIYMFNFICGFI